MSMLIVDAQVHIWSAPTPERPWPAGLKPQRTEPLGVYELLQSMPVAGVDRVVLVPPRIEGGRNDLSLEAAQRYPDRFAVMGKLDPTAPESREQLRGWRRQAGMLGLRFTLKNALEFHLTQGHMDWLWPVAEQEEIPLYIAITQQRAQVIADIAARHPRLRLALDHLAIKSDKLKDADAFRELDNVLALARFPNVAVKLTALPCYTTQAYPYRGLHPYLRRVYDAFGPERMFWGSDLSRLRGSYRECVTMFTEEMPWLGSQDLEWIMGRALCEWLGWRT
jgi:predicted TIM-barrel fold metal-dependent hydrolase